MGSRAGKVSRTASLVWLLPGCAIAEMTIDGNLDEDGWKRAHEYTAFRTTIPLLLNEPPFSTRARVLASAEGLALAIECEQPKNLRVRGRSQRDALTMDADTVSVVVDFEGGGGTAYEFTVSLSGSVRDGVVLQQNRVDYAWDAAWYSAVRETDAGWQIEILLPWSIAPMGASRGEHRTIGLYVGRELRARAQRFAYPGIPPQSPSFVSDFQKIDIPLFDTVVLNVTPYGAISRNLLTESTNARGGLDVAWRPTTEQQLTATLNPDFGQIESDELLVNFTGLEIFVPDKRPFFTENQQLFDVRTTDQDRLLHTKRIGAAPDAGPEDSTDILGAAKYLWTGTAWQLGTFAAAEDDSTVARGRTFAAARSRWRTDTWSLGYLGTFTDRPTLDRSASVQSADGEWFPASGWRVTSQFITTQIAQQGLSRDGTGYGALAKVEYAGTAPLTETLYLTWYDRGYDTNDMGFLERNDLRELWSQTRWYYRREYPAESPLSESQWYFSLRARTNQSGERLPSSLQIAPYWQYRDGSSLLFYVQAFTSGIDDLSSSGNGAFVVPPQHRAHLSFLSDPSRAFQYFWHFKLFREGLQRYGWEAQFKPSWWPSERLKLGVIATYRDSPDWLIWRADAQRVMQHERKLLQAMFSAEWFPNGRSELRFKLQWTGLQARGLSAYDIDPTHHLAQSHAVPLDLSRSELALQVRFRYELRPLSHVYIAYTFGGLALESEHQNFGRLWNGAMESRTGHQLMIKVAYKL
jgi:hypothetical protein